MLAACQQPPGMQGAAFLSTGSTQPDLLLGLIAACAVPAGASEGGADAAEAQRT